MITDPIADMLTRIRNAALVHKSEVLVPSSKVKFAIAKLLEKASYVEKVELKKGGSPKFKFDTIRIKLKYKGRECVIHSLKRISKPGLRVYVRKNEVPNVLNNKGVAIISTPSGMMLGSEARKKGLGGELICEIY